MRRLIQAGYPVRAEDMRFSQWTDLGLLTEAIDTLESRNRMDLLMGVFIGSGRR